MSLWQLFFGWPTGGVWSNLIASAITTSASLALVGWRLLIKLRQEHELHRQLMAQQLDDHHERVLQTVKGGDHGTQSHAGS